MSKYRIVEVKEGDEVYYDAEMQYDSSLHFLFGEWKQMYLDKCDTVEEAEECLHLYIREKARATITKTTVKEIEL